MVQWAVGTSAMERARICQALASDGLTLEDAVRLFSRYCCNTTSPVGWLCTRERGHEGVHVAHASKTVLCDAWGEPVWGFESLVCRKSDTPDFGA